jgi:hypothetical protein
VKVTGPECPRLSAEFLRQEKAEIGRWMYQQEHLCKFVDPATQMFKTAEIEGAFTDDVEPLFGGETAPPDAPPVTSESETADPFDADLETLIL